MDDRGHFTYLCNVIDDDAYEKYYDFCLDNGYEPVSYFDWRRGNV